MNQTIGIEYVLGVGYVIHENGVKLPMVFETSEAACHHAELLKCWPLSPAEIRAVVNSRRPIGDFEYPMQRRNP